MICIDLHALSERDAVIVERKVVPSDGDLISIDLDNYGHYEEATGSDSTVAIILFWEPFVMDVTATGYVVVVYIHSEPEANYVSGIEVIVGDEVNFECAIGWCYTIDVNHSSRKKVVKVIHFHFWRV